MSAPARIFLCVTASSGWPARPAILPHSTLTRHRPLCRSLAHISSKFDTSSFTVWHVISLTRHQFEMPRRRQPQFDASSNWHVIKHSWTRHPAQSNTSSKLTVWHVISLTCHQFDTSASIVWHVIQHSLASSQFDTSSYIVWQVISLKRYRA